MKKVCFAATLLILAILVFILLSHTPGNAQSPELFASIDAAKWKEVYPNEYNTWLDSATNWGESVGKPVTMTYAVQISPKISAGCVSCHSTAFVNMLATYGGDVVNLTEAELIAEGTASEGINCYSCHGDQPGELFISKGYITDAAAAGGIDTNDPNLVCAQCHSLPNRAYEEKPGSFTEDLSVGVMGDPDTNTWSTLSAGTNAEDVYEWYISHGEKNPKVITGEMEYQQYHGSTMDRAGVTCATCHMEKVDGETPYTRHAWQGAHVNPVIYENCTSCHTMEPKEMQRHVLELQGAYQMKLSEVKGTVYKAYFLINNSDADEQVIARATDIWFEARFYYCYGQDSSEGIHGIGNANTDYCFDRCLDLCKTIDKMVLAP